MSTSLIFNSGDIPVTGVYVTKPYLASLHYATQTYVSSTLNTINTTLTSLQTDQTTQDTIIATLNRSDTTQNNVIMANVQAVTAVQAQQVIDETNLNAEVTRATAAETQNASDIATAVQSASDQQNANYNFWNNRVFAIETNVAALQSGVGTAGSVDYSAQIAAIQATAVTDEQNISTLNGYTINNDQYMTALNNSIADKAGEIYRLQIGFDNIGQTIGNVSAQLALLQATVTSSGSTAALQTSVAQLQRTTTASLTALNTSLTSLSTSDVALQTAVASLQRTGLSVNGSGNVQVNSGLSVLGPITEENDAEAMMNTVWWYALGVGNNGAGKIRVHRKGNMITLQIWMFSVQYDSSCLPYPGAVDFPVSPQDMLPTWARPSRFMSYIVPVAIDQPRLTGITPGILTITTNGSIGIRAFNTTWNNTCGISSDLTVSYLIG